MYLSTTDLLLMYVCTYTHTRTFLRCPPVNTCIFPFPFFPKFSKFTFDRFLLSPSFSSYLFCGLFLSLSFLISFFLPPHTSSLLTPFLFRTRNSLRHPSGAGRRRRPSTCSPLSKVVALRDQTVVVKEVHTGRSSRTSDHGQTRSIGVVQEGLLLRGGF